MLKEKSINKMMQQNEEKLERKKSKEKGKKLTKKFERKTKNDDPKFFKEKCEKLPEKYRKMFALKGHNIDDFKKKQMPSDGLCGSHCVVQHAHLQEGVEGARQVRRNTNIKLVTEWEDYKLDFPFDNEGNGNHTETVGMETITFENVEEFKDFLRSKEAEQMWMTQTCLQVIADTYQTPVNILETEVVRGRMRRGASEIEKEGARVRARWTVISPNPNI